MGVPCSHSQASMPDALIHLRVPAATKARWVRESRSAGLRLTGWVVAAVEAQHPDVAWCQLCEREVTPIRDEFEVICPSCKLVL